MAHTSYLINLATNKQDILEKSKLALVEELKRCDKLGIDYAVLHPGAHLGVGEGLGVAQVSQALDEICEMAGPLTTKIVIENTAGQGTCVGHRFEHIRDIFAGSKHRDRLGVCLDTQHTFASGYNMTDDAGYEAVWAEFDRTIGIANLVGFHLNDSKKQLGSRVDRHEHIGEGLLGMRLFWRLANDPRFADLPGVLETEPREGATPYKLEIELLRSLEGLSEGPAAPVIELPPVPEEKKSAKKASKATPQETAQGSLFGNNEKN